MQFGPQGIHNCFHLLYKLWLHLQHVKSIQRHKLLASLLENRIWEWLLQPSEMGFEKKSDFFFKAGLFPTETMQTSHLINNAFTSTKGV